MPSKHKPTLAWFRWLVCLFFSCFGSHACVEDDPSDYLIEPAHVVSSWSWFNSDGQLQAYGFVEIITPATPVTGIGWDGWVGPKRAMPEAEVRAQAWDVLCSLDISGLSEYSDALAISGHNCGRNCRVASAYLRWTVIGPGYAIGDAFDLKNLRF